MFESDHWQLTFTNSTHESTALSRTDIPEYRLTIHRTHGECGSVAGNGGVSPIHSLTPLRTGSPGIHCLLAPSPLVMFLPLSYISLLLFSRVYSCPWGEIIQ